MASESDAEPAVEGGGREDPFMELAVRTLIRMALFNERTKQPLKREDMARTCLSGQSRRFPDLLERANAELQDTFGMRLVPIEASSGRASSAASTSAARRQAVAKKQHGPAQYILVSALTTEQHGRLLGLRHSRLVELGLLAVVLLFTRLTGGQLAQEELERQVVALGYPTLSPMECRPLPQLVEVWTRQRYLSTYKRLPADADAEELMVGWGPRAFVEFPPQHLVFLCMDMVEHLEMHADESTQDLDREAAAVHLQQRLNAALLPSAP